MTGTERTMTTPSEIVEAVERLDRALTRAYGASEDPGIDAEIEAAFGIKNEIKTALEGLQSEVERLTRLILALREADAQRAAALAKMQGYRLAAEAHVTALVEAAKPFVRPEILDDPRIGDFTIFTATVGEVRALRKAHDSATPVIEGVETQ